MKEDERERMNAYALAGFSLLITDDYWWSEPMTIGG